MGRTVKIFFNVFNRSLLVYTLFLASQRTSEPASRTVLFGLVRFHITTIIAKSKVLQGSELLLEIDAPT
jgi:hypothetical protein